MLTFMDSDTYEQIALPADILGDRRPFLQDGMIVKIEYYGEEALNVTLPQKGCLQSCRDRAGGQRSDSGEQL